MIKGNIIMCNELNSKIRSCLDERLLDAEEDMRLKEASLETVCAGNVLISAASEELEEADQTIVDWAKENSVNLVIIEYGDPAYTQYGHASFGNIHNIEFVSISNEQFAILNSPKTVLYFRRIDQMRDKMVRRHLLDFMRRHLAILGDEKVYFAKNILFTIATISKDMDHYEKYELCTVDAKDAFLFKVK